MSATNYFENYVLDAILGSNRGASIPSTVYVALFTTAPDDTGAGTEVSGGGYARVAVTNNTTNWPAASGGSKSNGADIQFPAVTSSWGTITHWAIYDAATVGNMLLYGSLSLGITPAVTDTPFFAVGSLTVTCD